MGWKVPREWEGETAFIVGGGPSVLTQNLELLRGRKVIAINSSYAVVPWAEYLFFGDRRWFDDQRRRFRGRLAAFAGRIVTTDPNVNDPRILKLRNSRPDPKMPLPLKLSADPGAVPCRRTSLTAAINIGVLLGAKVLVLLGIDGQPTQDGRTHHHDPHPWEPRRDRAGNIISWQRQRPDLENLVEPLNALGVTVLNASPGSAFTMWPIVNLDDVLRDDRRMVA